jgi:hypothetical protein
MPKDFLDCVKHKGRIRTIKPTLNTYIRICYDKKGVHRGEVHKNKVNVSPQSYTCNKKCKTGNKCKNKTTKQSCWRHTK